MSDIFQPPTPEQMTAMSPELRAELAASFLSTLKPGRQPLPLFEQTSRLLTLPTVELVLIRQNEQTGAYEGLLTPRPPTDLWWPNLWHVPGTAVLPTDAEDDIGSYASSFQRILQDELSGSVELTAQPVLFDAHHRVGLRGHEKHRNVYGGAEQRRPLPNGAFLDLDTLRAKEDLGQLVVGHLNLVQRAFTAYGTVS